MICKSQSSGSCLHEALFGLNRRLSAERRSEASPPQGIRKTLGSLKDELFADDDWDDDPWAAQFPLLQAAGGSRQGWIPGTMTSTAEPNYYPLGLDPDSDADALKRAFRRAVAGIPISTATIARRRNGSNWSMGPTRCSVTRSVVASGKVDQPGHHQR